MKWTICRCWKCSILWQRWRMNTRICKKTSKRCSNYSVKWPHRCNIKCEQWNKHLICSKNVLNRASNRLHRYRFDRNHRHQHTIGENEEVWPERNGTTIATQKPNHPEKRSQTFPTYFCFSVTFLLYETKKGSNLALNVVLFTIYFQTQFFMLHWIIRNLCHENRNDCTYSNVDVLFPLIGWYIFRSHFSHWLFFQTVMTYDFVKFSNLDQRLNTKSSAYTKTNSNAALLSVKFSEFSNKYYCMCKALSASYSHNN